MKADTPNFGTFLVHQAEVVCFQQRLVQYDPSAWSGGRDGLANDEAIAVSGATSVRTTS